MRRRQVVSKALSAASGSVFCLALGLAGCTSSTSAASGFSYSEDVPHATPSKAIAPPPNAPAPIVTTQPTLAAQAGEPITALAVPTGNRETSVLLVEQVGASEARVGVPYSYQLRVTNLTNMPVSGVVLDQDLPGDFKLASNPATVATTNKATTQPGVATDTHKRLEIGELGPRESKTVEVTGTPTHAGAFDTRLRVQYSPPFLYAHVDVVAPVLRITTQGPKEADICQEIVCRYTVANVGSGTAHGVAFQEKLPEGLLSAETEGVISAALGNLAPGESKDFTAHLRAVRPGKYATMANAISSDAPTARSEPLITSVLSPSLTITITGPRESYIGLPVTYQISVTNRGDAPASHTRLRLGTTPGRADFVGVESADGTPLHMIPESDEQELGTIPPGQTRTAVAHFKPKEGGPVTADVTALANCAEPAAASASTRVVTVAAPSLTVTHDPDPVAIGSNVVYHITVKNKGTAPDQNVAVSAILPGSTQLIHAGGGTPAQSEAQRVRFEPIPVLQPGQSVTWQVEVKALRADDAQFLASMTSASLPKPVVRLESTTFFGLQGGTVTGTSDVPASAPSIAPATQPADHASK